MRRRRGHLPRPAIALDHARPERRAPRRLRHRALRQLQHFKRPRTVGQAAQEAALLERRDQPVDAGLGRQIQGFLHLVERGGDASLLDPVVDEQQEFALFLREHRSYPLIR